MKTANINFILSVIFQTMHRNRKSFLCPEKQVTPEENWRIQRLKCCITTNNNKDEDNSLKNHIQNIAHQASSQKFKQINFVLVNAINSEENINIQWNFQIKKSTNHNVSGYVFTDAPSVCVYIYIYIYICVCVCTLLPSLFHMHE